MNNKYIPQEKSLLEQLEERLKQDLEWRGVRVCATEEDARFIVFRSADSVAIMDQVSGEIRCSKKEEALYAVGHLSLRELFPIDKLPTDKALKALREESEVRG